MTPCLCGGYPLVFESVAALKVVDRFAVPADGGMSAWLPIRVRSFPVRTGGVLRLDVSLPPGSDKGPRILRRVLRRLGARSYPQWRAWLALAYLVGPFGRQRFIGCGLPGRAWREIPGDGW